MLKPLMRRESFVIRLVPIHTLTSSFLFNILQQAVELIKECGGKVLALVCDNASVNRKVYKMLRQSKESPWIGNFTGTSTSTGIGTNTILLHDTVHLMKCVRNNWISEKTKQLEFQFGEGDKIVAKWEDVVDLYKSEAGCIVKRTKLSRESVFPSTFDLQKVSLVLNVFNEKTVAALVADGKFETARFIDTFLKFWKIVNVKNPNLWIALNDTDRKPISDVNDFRLKFLKTLSASIQSMPGEKGAQRIRHKSLTSATRDSLTNTIHGLISVTEKLLSDSACSYVMLGIFQSDPLESEFGIYRQSSGGNYFIGFEQILQTAAVRRMQLLHRLDALNPSEASHTERECCEQEITSTEIDLLDDLPDLQEALTSSELQSLFYICGYIAFKEGITYSDENPERPQCADFISLVNRGKLSYPSQSLFQFSVMCYSFFKEHHSSFSCSRRLVNIFKLINDSANVSVDPLHSICQRLANIFF